MSNISRIWGRLDPDLLAGLIILSILASLMYGSAYSLVQSGTVKDTTNGNRNGLTLATLLLILL